VHGIKAFVTELMFNQEKEVHRFAQKSTIHPSKLWLFPFLLIELFPLFPLAPLTGRPRST